MTTKELRDAFAALAFTRIACGDHDTEELAEKCYDFADAMIFESELREMEYEADQDLCNAGLSDTPIGYGSSAPMPLESGDASFADD